MTVLPEIRVARNRDHYACQGADKLEFPAKCPACGAPKTNEDSYSAAYSCGAAYSPKPQCQTHTDVYWGVCRKAQASR